MHIVWINDNANFAGGAEWYIANVVPGVRDTRTRCTLLYDPLRPTDHDFFERFDDAYPLVAPLTQIADLAPDVIFVHNFARSRLLPGLRRGGTPVACYFHDHRLFCLTGRKYTTFRHRTCTRKAGLCCYGCAGFLNRSEHWPGIRLRTLRGLHREQECYRSMDAFVVGSDYMRKHSVIHGFDPQRVRVIAPFLNGRDKPAVVARDPHRLLFVGSLIRGKGLDTLLEAMVGIPSPVCLSVAGTGRQEDWFVSLVRRQGLGKRVEFMGDLDAGALDAAYRNAACVVIPSRAPETFSRVGPEALLRGTPVIASDVGGVREWLQHGETGIAVPSNDPRSLAQSIRFVLDNPQHAQKLAERGRVLCRRNYSAGDNVDKLMALFNSLAPGRSVQ